MAIVRMICAPVVCCVHPSAYMMVMTLSGAAVSAISSQTFRKRSGGVPVIRVTISVV